MFQDDISLLRNWDNNLYQLGYLLWLREVNELENPKSIRTKTFMINCICKKLQGICESIDTLEEEVTSIDLVVTRDSYEKIKEKKKETKEALQKIRFLSIPTVNLLKEPNLRDISWIKELLYFLSIDFLSFGFALCELEEVEWKESKIPFHWEVYENYSDLGEIFLDSLKKDYEYETYRELTDSWLKYQILKEKVMEWKKIQEYKAYISLKENAKEVIERNLENEEIISLYSKEDLLLYERDLYNRIYSPKMEEASLEDCLNLERLKKYLGGM